MTSPVIQNALKKVERFPAPLLSMLFGAKPKITMEKAHTFPASIMHTFPKITASDIAFKHIPKNQPAHIYIQIPWCKIRCLYCRYPSIIKKPNKVEVQKYFIYLEKELMLYAAKLERTKIFTETIYIGGGTPTILSASELTRLFAIITKYCAFDSQAFKIIECSPSTITEKKIQAFKNFGINRVSMGVQSFNRTVLKRIFRSKDNYSRVKTAIRLLRKYEIPEINFDVMLGLPEQTYEIFLRDIETATRLCPSSISFLDMEVWQGCGLYILSSKESVDDAFNRWKMQLVMTAMYQDYLESSNYIPTRPHYYVLPADMRHPSTRVPYLDSRMAGFQIGLGIGALGHIGTTVYRNFATPTAYETALAQNVLPIDKGMRLSAHDAHAMRTIRSLCDETRFPEESKKQYTKIIHFLTRAHFLDEQLKLTATGRLFGSEIMYMLYPKIK